MLSLAQVRLYAAVVINIFCGDTHFKNEKMATKIEYPNYFFVKQVPNYMHQKLKVKGLELLGKKADVNCDKQMCRYTMVENHWYTDSRMALVPFFSCCLFFKKNMKSSQ